MPLQRRPTLGPVAVTTFRSDGLRLATTGPNGDLKLWDTTHPAEPELLVRMTSRHRTIAAAWNPVAADLIATMTTGSVVTLWRTDGARTPRDVLTLTLPHGRFGPLTWLPDGRHLACAVSDGSLTVWDTVSGERHTLVLGADAPCLDLAASPDNGLRVVYGDGTVRRADPLERDLPLRTRRLLPLSGAAWSAGGRMLATVRDGGTVELHDETMEVRWQHRTPAEGTLVLAWNGTSEIVVADRRARWILALDVAGRLLWQDRLDREPAAMSAVRGMLAVGSSNFSPLLLDVMAGEQV